MADYIGISKPLIVAGVTPKPEINYFYGPWESVEEALDNIPQLARIKGLTVGIIEGSEIVEYWFKNGVNLVLKLVDPELVYTTDEIQQIINGLGNTYVQKEVGKVLIPSTSLDKLNQLPTKESNDNTYVAKEVGKSLIADSKITKLDSLPNSVYTQAETQQIIDVVDTKVDNKVDKVTGSRLLTDLEANVIANAVTRTTFEERLSKKVDAVQGAGLITDSERISIANAVDSDTLYTELLKKVDKVSGERLITTPEIQKLQNAATVSEITAETDKCVKIDTSEIELVSEDYTGVVLYSRDETQDKLLKIDVSTFIADIKAEADVVYPTYRSLVGTQNGSNTQFEYSGTLIQETAELYIGGMLYPVNIGFTFEGDTIVITGAPIPTAEDIMRLKAIYLT